MRKQTAISRLQAHKQALRRMGATSLYLFGSTAKNAAGNRSDIDLFIDYDPKRRLSLFDLLTIRDYLEQELHTQVDLATRDSLHPMLRKGIEQSAVRVF